MSTFEDERFRWRETYFVLLSAKKRPKLKKVVQTLAALDPRYELTNQNADEEGCLESLTLVAADDYAAIDICYIEGEEVTEQTPELLKELKTTASAETMPLLSQIAKCDARLDVLHFQQVDADAEDGEEEMFDPSTLLLVMSALSKLTGGIAVDPQSGTILERD